MNIEEFAPIECTDLGNAKRFVELSNGKMKYLPEKKVWYYFDGLIWREDKGRSKVHELSQMVLDYIQEDLEIAQAGKIEYCKRVMDETGAYPAKEDKNVELYNYWIKILKAWLFTSQGKDRFFAMSRLAESKSEMIQSFLDYDNKQ